MKRYAKLVSMITLVAIALTMISGMSSTNTVYAAERTNFNYIDELDNFDNVYSKTSNMSLDTLSPTAYFSGDGSRATRSDTNAGSIVYNKTGILGYDIEVYYNGELGTVKLYTSVDNANWNQNDISVGTPVPTGSGWYKVSLKPSGSNPLNGTQNYLKIEIVSAYNGTAWGTQIGEVKIACTSFNDVLSDYSKVYSKTSNMVIDTSSSSQYFEGDTARATRSDTSAASFIYYKYDLSNYAIKVYYNGNIGNIKVYKSSNGTAWTEVANTLDTAVNTGSSWYRTYLRPSAGVLDYDTNFLKIEIISTGNGTAWGTQIGDVVLGQSYFSDDLNNYDLTYMRTSNMSIDTSSAGTYFEGDGSRATKSSTSAGSMIYHKNDFTDYRIKLFYNNSIGTFKTYTSSDGISWTERTFDMSPAMATASDWYRIYITPNVTIPTDTNYLKLEIQATGNGQSWGTQIGEVYINVVDDPIAEIKDICLKKNITFNDFFSSTHAAGKYNFTSDPYLKEGADLIASMGAKAINVWFDAKIYDNQTEPNYELSYPFNSTWGTAATTLTELAQKQYYSDLFSRSDFDTYILMTTQPGNIEFDQSYNSSEWVAAMQQEYDQIHDLAEYLLTTYENTGKTFIIQTWESDWWCANVYGDISQGYNSTALSNLQGWINQRQDAVTDARAHVTPQGVNVYNCLEVNNLLSALNNETCVTVNVVPNTYCDLYAYSSYQLAMEYEPLFDAGLKKLKELAPNSSFFGNNNVYIGEWGVNETNRGENYVFNCGVKSIKIALNNELKYFNYWNALDNEWNSGTGANNSDYAGFWLKKRDGSKSIIWPLLETLLK